MSSNSAISIGELKESYEKYSKKLRERVTELKGCSPKNKDAASKRVEKFLNDFKKAFNMDKKVSREDDNFIEALREYPEGTLAAHYTKLWDNLNEFETMNLEREELLTFIDSAVLEFSRQFVESNRREFAAELADADIGYCMFE